VNPQADSQGKRSFTNLATSVVFALLYMLVLKGRVDYFSGVFLAELAFQIVLTFFLLTGIDWLVRLFQKKRRSADGDAK
jgi:hypothetical protein